MGVRLRSSVTQGWEDLRQQDREVGLVGLTRLGTRPGEIVREIARSRRKRSVRPPGWAPRLPSAVAARPRTRSRGRGRRARSWSLGALASSCCSLSQRRTARRGWITFLRQGATRSSTLAKSSPSTYDRASPRRGTAGGNSRRDRVDSICTGASPKKKFVPRIAKGGEKSAPSHGGTEASRPAVSFRSR